MSKHMAHRFLLPLLLLLPLSALRAGAQTIYEYKQEDARILFFDKNLSQYIPHIVRMYENGKALHEQIWWPDSLSRPAIQPPMMMLSDWADDGNGGAASIPQNMINIEMAPLNFSYFISPSTERYHHLFRHEYTHIVMSDKASSRDMFWRKALGGKFTVDPTHPFSAVWSYLGAPRWYAPRWYHEGIACFMETWTGGGVGRALGGYDEMFFRSIVDSGEPLYSVVGLEMEGTTSDFQVGTNSYLYGTRFVNYLQMQYGFDKLRDFYNRTEDSKPVFSGQFKKVYGRNIREVWNDWRDFEKKHQREQLDAIAEFPLTETKSLTDKAMGSMSPLVLDEERGFAYTAVNYPGDFAHIERIDLNTLERKKISFVDDPQLYQTTYLTLDKKRQRLIWTTQNSKMRGLRVYDLEKREMVKRLNLQRVSNIVYDNAGDCMYGIFTNGGVMYLCRYDSEFSDRKILYSFPFGVSVFDLDVSHDGRKVSVTTSGSNGEQSLLLFDIEGLNNADFRYTTLYSMADSNLGQFRFAPGDSTMVGSSYYTGVSNLWELNLNTRELSLLTNTKTGLFSPVQTSADSLYALEFERNGMRPVSLKKEILHDANAVTMLGQLAYEAHPEELEMLSEHLTPVPDIKFGTVYDSIHVYKPFRALKFVGAYPEISGFRDKAAWNRVTPVLGYRFAFQDPLGLHSLKMSIGISPWSNNDPINQYHAQLDWKFWQWSVKAAWNPTSFYDLAGPLQSSRKGWQVSVAYEASRTLLPPVVHSYGGQIAAYGMMDALPLHQEISIDDGITSFQTATFYYSFSKIRSSLGAVMAESGISAGANAYAYLAGGKLFPTLSANCDAGFLLPFMRNTCLWFRSAVGQNFGDPDTVFGNEYFGGFGNNWVDYRAANRYRSVSSLAGAPIDAIKAHSYAKLMAELSLKPIRYSNLGFLNLYPTYTQLNFFGTALAADPWGMNGCRGFYNAGVQLNTEVVLFKYLKTTWSIGYAHVFGPGGFHQGDWLFSLKLL